MEVVPPAVRATTVGVADAISIIRCDPAVEVATAGIDPVPFEVSITMAASWEVLFAQVAPSVEEQRMTRPERPAPPV